MRMAANPQPMPAQKKRNVVPTEEMRQLYFDHGLQLAKVGKTVGLTGAAVKYRLVQAGFKLRPDHIPPTVPTEDLCRLYVDEKLSLAKVSKRVGLSISTVRKRLLRDGCALRERRRLSQSEESDLVDGYTRQQLTIKQLSERWGVSFSVIQRCLQRAEVSRPRGHATRGIWEVRNTRLAIAKQYDVDITAAKADIARLTGELQQAKTELAKAKAAKAEALPIADTIRKKFAEPEKYPWMSPNETAVAFGIGRSTFFRNVREYTRLRPNQTGQYSTLSVIEQLRNPPRKNDHLSPAQSH
jgi:transposase-like protein